MSNIEEKSIDDINELVETDNDDLKSFFDTVFFDTEVEQEAPEKDLDDGEDEDNEKIVKSINNLLKSKIYINDPSEAPEGVKVLRGKKGGLYYDTQTQIQNVDNVETKKDKLLNKKIENLEESAKNINNKLVEKIASPEEIKNFINIISNEWDKLYSVLKTLPPDEAYNKSEILYNLLTDGLWNPITDGGLYDYTENKKYTDVVELYENLSNTILKEMYHYQDIRQPLKISNSFREVAPNIINSIANNTLLNKVSKLFNFKDSETKKLFNYLNGYVKIATETASNKDIDELFDQSSELLQLGKKELEENWANTKEEASHALRDEQSLYDEATKNPTRSNKVLFIDSLASRIHIGKDNGFTLQDLFDIDWYKGKEPKEYDEFPEAHQAVTELFNNLFEGNISEKVQTLQQKYGDTSMKSFDSLIQKSADIEDTDEENDDGEDEEEDHIVKSIDNLIEKSKIYLNEDETSPNKELVFQGPRGGRYYTSQEQVLESPVEYWNKYLEHNPLRTMSNGQDTDAGAFLSNHLEGLGDILREFSNKTYIDRGYIFEKFNRYKNYIDSRDWYDPLSKRELEKVEETKKLLLKLATPDEFHKFLKTLMFDTLNRKRNTIEVKLPELRKLIEERLVNTNKIQKGADYDGAMISINIIDSVANKLVIEDGEPESKLHITLIYFKDIKIVNDNIDLIGEILERLCKQTKAFIINIKDTTIFPKSAETDELPLVAEVIKSKELMEFRKKLADLLDLNNIDYSKDFEYTPHITLKYLKSMEEAPEDLDINYTMLVDKIEFNIADNVEDFELSNKIEKMLEIKAPEEKKKEGKSIFLAGSIDMGAAEDWQDKLADELKDYNVTLYNPRRDDWDKSWKQDIDNKQFREQVEWELKHQEEADIIVVYFSKDSKAPITFLEFGLFNDKNKMIVFCPEGFYRKGNIDIVCKRYNIRETETWDEFVNSVKEKIENTEYRGLNPKPRFDEVYQKGLENMNEKDKITKQISAILEKSQFTLPKLHPEQQKIYNESMANQAKRIQEREQRMKANSLLLRKDITEAKKEQKKLKRELIGEIEHFVAKNSKVLEGESDIKNDVIKDKTINNTNTLKEASGHQDSLLKSNAPDNIQTFLKGTPEKSLIEVFLKGYEQLALLGLDYSDQKISKLYNLAQEVNTQKQYNLPLEDSDRIAKVISIDSVAHELHKSKNPDGSSNYEILDSLAALSKSYGETERSTRLIVLKSPDSVENIKKLLNIEILQKSDLDHSQSFWKLLEKAIKIGVEKLNNNDLIALREWIFAKI